MASRLIFLFSLVLFFSSESISQSIPPSGGELTYEYIGQRTAIPHHYIITLTIFKTVDTSAYTNQEAVITSSCFPRQVLNLKPFVPIGAPVSGHGGVQWPPSVNCMDTLNSDSIGLFAYYYQDTVVLPGICSDFEIGYAQCCRNKFVNNIIQPDSTKFFLGASLNNTYGPNSSAELSTYPPRYMFCKNQEVRLTIWASEPDGDSLNFINAPILDSNGRAVGYTPGFNLNNPLPTSNGYSPTSFTPIAAGIYSTVVRIEEYRYIQTIGTYVMVGSINQEINVVVRDTCADYLYASHDGGLIKSDTLYGVGCNDTIISFGTNTFSENGISIDASEFRIVGPDSILRPVVKASTNSNPALISDSVWLELHRAPLKNGVYFLYIKNGNYYTPCGNKYPDDYLYFVVSDCNTTSIYEKDIADQISIYPNPTQNRFILLTRESIPEKVILLDMTGRKLKSIETNSRSTEIDISDYATGMYLLSIDIGGRQITRLVEKSGS